MSALRPSLLVRAASFPPLPAGWIFSWSTFLFLLRVCIWISSISMRSAASKSTTKAWHLRDHDCLFTVSKVKVC
ncbi:hypothetical protein BC830DRAFT_787741 [Chytriomyces sp. MP71]|nr:hypothetical protein BC830DRAFT_787741 [Chytriomyces sp. MP71]